MAIVELTEKELIEKKVPKEKKTKASAAPEEQKKAGLAPEKKSEAAPGDMRPKPEVSRKEVKPRKGFFKDIRQFFRRKSGG